MIENIVSAAALLIGKHVMALSYTAVDENQIITTLTNWLCAVILVIGVVYGGWELAQGFMDDSPSKKKHGITVLIVGVSIAAVIYSIITMVMG